MSNNITYDSIRKRVSDNLSPEIKEFRKTIADISNNFRNLGLETAVWYSERIHTANFGGIDADSYVGYSRIEGRWGLMIRIIERDCENHSFIGQRVVTIESCSNMEMVVNALRKVPDLIAFIHKTTEQQIELLEKPDPHFEQFRKSDCRF
jgi:hypothetical protein